MVSQFYNEMREVADELLTEFGEPIQHLDGNQSVLGTYIGLKTAVQTQDVSQTVIDRSVATVYMTVGEGTAPVVNNYLRVDGVVYNIVYVNEHRPTSLTLLYAVYTSNGG